MRQKILLFISILCTTILSGQTAGSQIGNFLIVNKCHVATDGTKTDFYTLFSTQVGKSPKKIADYRTSNSTTFTVPGTGSVIGGSCPIQEVVCIEEYLIDGNSTGFSTPSVNNASNPVVGNQISLTAPFRSISWNFMPGTQVDPGDGSIAVLDVNGFSYYPRSSAFALDGYSMSGSTNQVINSNFTITASGACIVKVNVVKTNCE